MATFNEKYLKLIVTLTGLVVALRRGAAEEKTQHFNAGGSKDLRRLAHLDFELKVQLRTLKETWEAQGRKYSHTLFTSAVEAYLENVSNSSKRWKTDHGEEIVRNPLARFTVIHRLCYFLRSLNSLPDLAFISDSPVLSTLKDEFGNESFPLRNELTGAADAILNIQFMQNLTAAELSQGILLGMTSTATLQAYHCYSIGLTARFFEKYTLAVEWLVEAKRLAGLDDTVDIPTLNTELVNIIKYHDAVLSKSEFKDPNFFLKPLRFLESLETQEPVPTVKETKQRKYAGKGRNPSFWPMNVWALCSGQDLNTPEASAHLFCWHEYKMNKVFTIGPSRMEFLSRNPDVVQVHNAFSYAEVAEMRAWSNDPSVFTESDHHIERKLEAIMGLQTTGQTEFVSHLPGGRVQTHPDFIDANSDKDKLSTTMIYLNDASKGGYTVFPASFATAVPSKGSAVFWFNTLSDGSPDYSTSHEACPVAWGEKLVAYKTMRFSDQFQARKCSLRPKDRLRVLVNGETLPVPRVLVHQTIEQGELDEPEPLSVGEEAAQYNKLDDHVRKYAQSPSWNLEALIQLDWEIHEKIKRLLPQGTSTAVSSGQAQSLVLGYLKDFKENAYSTIRLNGTVAGAVGRLSRNPLAVYRVFWRFESYVKKVLRLSDEDLAKLREVRNYIGKVYNESDGPLKRDLEDIMTGILNMQFVYDLKSQDIAGGNVGGIDTGITLSAKQCIEIGSHAIAEDYFYLAINWMDTAVAKVAFENDTTFSLTEAEIQLETAKEVHDRFLVKYAEDDPNFYINPVSGLSNLTQLKTRKEAQYDLFKARTEFAFVAINLDGLCQGKRHQTIQEQSKLFCWYEHKIQPYFRVGPLQVELLSMHPNPEVVMYHDILNQRHLAFLRNHTGRDYNSCGPDSNYCRYVSSLVYGNHSEDALMALNWASSITGLSTARRAISVHEHLPTGHHGVHADSSGQEEGHGQENEGKGMSTFMFHAMEPEKGGMTVFPSVGIQIPIKAGSAVFWYNTLSSGALDRMSYHAGCPVIYGHKLVGTILMSYLGQSHLQCSTDPKRRMEVLVNGESKYGYR